MDEALKEVRVKRAGLRIGVRVGTTLNRSFIIESVDFGRLRKGDSFYILYPDDQYILVKELLWIDRDRFEVQAWSVEVINRLQLEVLKATQ